MKVDIFSHLVWWRQKKFQLFSIAVLEFGTGGQRICFNYWQLDPQTSNSHNPQFLHGHKTRFNLKGHLQFRLCKLKPTFPDFLQPADSEARIYLLELPSLMFGLSALSVNSLWAPYCTSRYQNCHDYQTATSRKIWTCFMSDFMHLLSSKNIILIYLCLVIIQDWFIIWKILTYQNFTIISCSGKVVGRIFCSRTRCDSTRGLINMWLQSLPGRRWAFCSFLDTQLFRKEI